MTQHSVNALAIFAKAQLLGWSAYVASGGLPSLFNQPLFKTYKKRGKQKRNLPVFRKDMQIYRNEFILLLSVETCQTIFVLISTGFRLGRTSGMLSRLPGAQSRWFDLEDLSGSTHNVLGH